MSENLTSELTENLIEFCESRKSVYALLSRCYEKELDAAFASDFAAAPALISDDKALAEGFALCSPIFRTAARMTSSGLPCRSTGVFFWHGPAHCPEGIPVRILYTSSSGLMMQDAYAQVRIFITPCALRKPPTSRSPRTIWPWSWRSWRACDVAVDAFEGDAAAAETALSAQLSFLRDHLLNWIDRFVVDAKKADDGGFYEGFGCVYAGVFGVPTLMRWRRLSSRACEARGMTSKLPDDSWRPALWARPLWGWGDTVP